MDLKAKEDNPRFITDYALEGLKESMARFGDIGGVVFNRRNGHLIGGHQRVRAIREFFKDAMVVIKKNEEFGKIQTGSGDFMIRVVDWSTAKENEANLAANNPAIMGSFTEEAKDMIEAMKAKTPEIVEALHLDELWDRLSIELRQQQEKEEKEKPVDDRVTVVTCPQCGHEWPFARRVSR